MRNFDRAVHWRRVCFRKALLMGALAGCALTFSSSARAVVLISDGFGDGDLNNNGIPLEPQDVDVSSAGNGTVGPYTALGTNQGSPPVFGATPQMVNELTAVENASDVGIKWFSMGPWTGTNPD